MVPHSYALFDEIVFVPLQFVFQTIALSLVLLVFLFHPLHIGLGSSVPTSR